MHNFKKALLSTFSVLLAFIIISCVVIVPFQNSQHGYFQDHKLRQSLSGSIDCLIIGASNSLNAVDTRVIDKRFGYNSYNLSCGMMTLDAMYFLLEKELARNPVKTVYFDISYQTLMRDYSSENAQCEEAMLGRLDNSMERIKYIFDCVSYDNWLNAYSIEFVSGLEYWLRVAQNGNKCGVNYDLKGFKIKSPNDIRIAKEDIDNKHNSNNLNYAIRQDNLKKLDKIVDLCRSYDVNMVFFTVPVSNEQIWNTYGQQIFYYSTKQYVESKGYEYYDFNLLKNRYEILNDEYSFFDCQHLSESGANAFSNAMCDVLLISEEQDKKNLFYDNYDCIKDNSPYSFN